MKKDKGQGMIEYAVLVAIVVAIIIVAASPLGQAVNAAYIRASDTINNQS